MGGGAAGAWESAITSAALNLQLKTLIKIMSDYREVREDLQGYASTFSFCQMSHSGSIQS